MLHYGIRALLTGLTVAFLDVRVPVAIQRFCWDAPGPLRHCDPPNRWRQLMHPRISLPARVAAAVSRGAPIPFATSGGGVVPACRGEKVILRTIETLGAQEYPGQLEVVNVDDGSPDDTYEVARAAYGDHPRVRGYRRPDGGQAGPAGKNSNRINQTGRICFVCAHAGPEDVEIVDYH